MKTSTITLAAMLAISACAPDVDDELDHDQDDDRIVLEEAMNDMLWWVVGEAASFVTSEAFGLALPEEAVDLSAETMAEIEHIVTEAIQDQALRDRNASFKGVVQRFNAYNRAPCETLAESGDCSISELNHRSEEALDILNAVVDHYNVYVAWGTHGDPLLTDEDWRVYLSPNVRLAVTMDLTLRRERYEIDFLKGLDVARETWEDLKANAGEYGDLLEGIERKYAETAAKFEGESYVENLGSRHDARFVGCYKAPEGQWCTDEVGHEVTQSCTDSIQGSWCSPTDEELEDDKDALKAAATEHRSARLANFMTVAIGDQESFDTMQEHLKTLADGDGPGDCEPGRRAIEAGPLVSDVVAQEKCPGVCEAAKGTFTGQWWTTVPEEMSVCQCDLTC